MQESAAPRRMVYWHRELPPIDAEPLSENIVEADSVRVQGTLEHRNELWDRCYADLMNRLTSRLEQEIVRLGGDCAHVLDESIDSHHDDASGDVWLHGRLTYLLMKRPPRPREGAMGSPAPFQQGE